MKPVGYRDNNSDTESKAIVAMEIYFSLPVNVAKWNKASAAADPPDGITLSEVVLGRIRSVS